MVHIFDTLIFENEIFYFLMSKQDPYKKIEIVKKDEKINWSMYFLSEALT